MSTELLIQWTGLPDPADAQRTKALLIYRKGLEHIAQKHITNQGEPWREWLGEEACKKLVALAQEPGRALEAPCVQALNRLFDEAQAAMGAPLLLTFLLKIELGDGSRGWVDRRLLVLPGGARMILTLQDQGFRLVTCYFTRGVAERKPASRWRTAAHQVVERYVKYDPGVGLVAPDPEKSIEFRGGRREKKITFVSPENWGFRSVSGRSIWWRLSPEWPGGATAGAMPPRRRRRKLQSRLKF